MGYIGSIIIFLLIIANILIIIRVIKTGKFGTITLFEKDDSSGSPRKADSGPIAGSIRQMMEYTPPDEEGGFVIFNFADLKYVQYTLMPNGLLLWWPTVMEGGADHLPQFDAYFAELGFVKIDPTDDTAEMPVGHYYTCEDGLYAQCGRDVENLSTITRDLLTRCFGMSDESQLTITLELDG